MCHLPAHLSCLVLALFPGQLFVNLPAALNTHTSTFSAVGAVASPTPSLCAPFLTPENRCIYLRARPEVAERHSCPRQAAMGPVWSHLQR